MSILGQQPRAEWEMQWPDYMRERFELWRAGIRDWRASDPAAYAPHKEAHENPKFPPELSQQVYGQAIELKPPTLSAPSSKKEGER